MAHVAATGGAWALAVEILMPIPVVLLCFLSLPLPKNMQRALVKHTYRVMSIQFVQFISLANFGMAISGCIFMNASYKLYMFYLKMAKTAEDDDIAMKPEAALQMHSDKWRLERNWWIALMCIIAWVSLLRFYQLALESAYLKEKIADLEGKPAMTQDLPPSAFPAFVSNTPEVDAPSDAEVKKVT